MPDTNHNTPPRNPATPSQEPSVAAGVTPAARTEEASAGSGSELSAFRRAENSGSTAGQTPAATAQECNAQSVAPENLSPCDAFEEAILDHFDTAPSGTPPRELQEHLAACAACGAFWTAQQQLDAALSSALAPRAPLASDFKERLLDLARAEIEAGILRSEESVRRDTERLLAETRSRLVRQSIFKSLDLTSALAVLGAVVAIACQQLASTGWFSALTRQQPELQTSLVLAALCLAAGLWAAFGNRLRPLLDW